MKRPEPAPRNRTLRLSPEESARLSDALSEDPANDFVDRVIRGDAIEILPKLPEATFDLLFVDPPYNLAKQFGDSRFAAMSTERYEEWTESWMARVAPLLKPTASLYVCADWRASGAVQRVLERRFKVQNRITWEREKGRGALRNWKNASEDIWFCTMGDRYHFDSEAVKIKRRVIAPYKEPDGRPRDWNAEQEGNFRLTFGSNLWTDLTVPFWSMPENTDHPTQKPEKLVAKAILASTKPGDLVLDPFAGSGTTAVVAKKLGRRFTAIEAEAEYCALALKRLELAESDPTIQGYEDGVFWERNSGR